MTTSNVEVTEGTGKKLATHSISEDAATKHVSRVNLNDAAGADILGSKTDDKSTATDTTAVSAISLWKQISASIQTLAGAVGSAKVATKSASGDFADGAIATLGAKADAKSTATDTTAITVMQVIKQISASVQALVTGTVLAAGSALIGNVGHGKTIKTASGSLTADTDVIAAVTSKRIKVIAYSLISTGTSANAAIFKTNGTGGTELWRVILQAPAASSVFGANLSIPAPSFLFATAAGEKLTLDVGNSDTIHYSIAYFDDDAS